MILYTESLDFLQLLWIKYKENRENRLMWDKVLGAWFQCHVPWGCCGAGEGSGGDVPAVSWGWGQAVQFFLLSKQPIVRLSILPDPGASREPCARLDMARLPAALRLTRCMQMSTRSAEQLLITYQRRELHGHPILMHSWMSFLHTSVLSACIYGYRERHGNKEREEHIYKVDCIGVQRCIYTQCIHTFICTCTHVCKNSVVYFAWRSNDPLKWHKRALPSRSNSK